MILVSVGHNENAQGASYLDDGYEVTEFNLANKWVDLIVDLLNDKGAKVPVGRLTDKVNFINNFNPSPIIAIEIHFNSFKKWIDLDDDGVIDSGEMIAMGKGSETLYMPGSVKGIKYADIVQSGLGLLMQPNRGIKKGWYQMNPAKGPDYFLKATNCPAIIIEPEFIDNIDVINNNMDSACHIIANALLEIYYNDQ